MNNTTTKVSFATFSKDPAAVLAKTVTSDVTLSCPRHEPYLLTTKARSDQRLTLLLALLDAVVELSSVDQKRARKALVLAFPWMRSLDKEERKEAARVILVELDLAAAHDDLTELLSTIAYYEDLTKLSLQE